MDLKTKDEINVITDEVVEETLRLLRDDVYKIVLYGSYARGDFTPESDIDIMIILKCGKEKTMQYRKEISHISSRISLKNDVEVSLLLRDKDTYENGRNALPFYTNVKREGVALYE